MGGGEFLDWLSDYQFLVVENFVTWRLLSLAIFRDFTQRRNVI